MPEIFVQLEDKFEVKCKECGSTDVTLNAEDCHECGSLISAKCEVCGNEFDYHKFERVK